MNHLEIMAVVGVLVSLDKTETLYNTFIVDGSTYAELMVMCCQTNDSV